VSTSHEQCDACDFDGARLDDATLLDDLRALGPRWQRLLDGAGRDLRVRPAPEVWSAIEYAAHSRDITALHAFGVEQALTGTEPVLPDIDPALADTVAVDAGYAAADPDAVVAALGEHAQRLARLAVDAGTAAWTHGITIGRDRSDVRRLLEHALHDAHHHVIDVERGLAQLRATGGAETRRLDEVDGNSAGRRAFGPYRRVMSSFVSRWVVCNTYDVAAEHLDANGVLRPDALAGWIADARDAYLAEVRSVQALVDRGLLLRAAVDTAGAPPIVRPARLVVSAGATEVYPASFTLAFRVRGYGAGGDDVVVNLAASVSLEDPATGAPVELGNEVRDELIALEHAARHTN